MIIAPRRRKNRRKSGPDSAATESGLQTRPLNFFAATVAATVTGVSRRYGVE
jgi:hypothetical protein